MSGLDDVRVQKGRDNWLRIEQMWAEVSLLGVNDPVTKAMSKRIKTAELFYKTDFVPHLLREGSHKCNCLTCGFHSNENPADIERRNKHTHLPSCTRCSEGFTIILELETVIQATLDNLRKSFSKSVDPVNADLHPTSEAGDPIVGGGQNTAATITRPAPPPVTREYCHPCFGRHDGPSTAAKTSASSTTSKTAAPPAPVTTATTEATASTTTTATTEGPPPLQNSDSSDEFDFDPDSDDDTQAPVEERMEQEVGSDPIISDPDAPINSWESLKVYELRDECRERGLPISGNKKVLIDRIINYQELQDDDDSNSPSKRLEKLSRLELVDECKKRHLAVTGTKPVLINRIVADIVGEDPVVQDSTNPLRELTMPELLQLQKFEELFNEIKLRKDDLIEYRSHLARHKSEEEYARQELENLADDEAIITSDFKMKILSCFFRENQKKWFGKRGTTLLGFMITTNTTIPEEKAKGLKDVSFVMMVTDDVMQDEHEVASAKAVVYKEYLPPHITKVRFTSDGAGCFKSQLHRALQPFWKQWVGIDEISYRITPAGDGKSRLDGMFGRLNSIMASSVNMGASYWNAKTVLEACETSNGLSATQFVLFAPDRRLQMHANVKMNLEAVLLTTLNPDRREVDNKTMAFKHSGFGNGSAIDPTMIQFSCIETDDRKKQKKNDGIALDGVYLPNGKINKVVVDRLIPKCILNEARDNAKAHLKSTMSMLEEGKSSKKVRAAKKKGRIAARAEKKKESIEERREAMRSSGLFICDARCPETSRYCRGKFLLKSSWDRHNEKQTHSFATGIRARDYMLLAASKPGGLVSFGKRPDRNSKELFQEITPAMDGSRAEVAARCHGNFNRKEKVKGYAKPKRLLFELERLYNIEPKLRAKEMRDAMKGMKDKDGGLLFCNAKRNTNGLLLSEDQIQSWINQRTQKKKKASKEPTEKEVKQAELVAALQKSNPGG